MSLASAQVSSSRFLSVCGYHASWPLLSCPVWSSVVDPQREQFTQGRSRQDSVLSASHLCQGHRQTSAVPTLLRGFGTLPEAVLSPRCVNRGGIPTSHTLAGDCCCCLVDKLCPTLATLWTAAHQAPLSMGFPEQEYWTGLPFLQGMFPTQGSYPFSCITARFFAAELLEKHPPPHFAGGEPCKGDKTRPPLLSDTTVTQSCFSLSSPGLHPGEGRRQGSSETHMRLLL